MSSKIVKAKDVTFDMFLRMAQGAGLDAIECSEDIWILTGGAEPVEYYRSDGIPPKKVIRQALGKRQKESGKISPRARRHRDLLFARHPYCHWCNKKLTKETRTLEHLLPISMGGTDALKNLRLACPECNSQRDLSVQRIPKWLYRPRKAVHRQLEDTKASKPDRKKRHRPRRGGLDT